MANWTGVITNAGTSLLGEWVDEKTLTITSAQAGTGTVPTAGLMAQTALVSPKQTAAIAGGGEFQGGKRISLQVPAAQEAYTLNQFGVYAKVDEGSPVLLAIYQNEQGIPIPSLSETPDFLYTFLAGISVSNQGHWEVTISASASLTWELVGVPNGIAGLDENGKVPKEQLPEMDAASVAYDNGSSGLGASTVQGALDELVTGLNEGTIAQADATLASTGWTGDTPTQTLSVPGLPANSPAWIGLAIAATAAQRDAARKAALSPTSRAAGSVTITADGAQPTTDLPVTVYYVKKAPEGGAELLASIINMFPGGSTLQIPLDAPTALTATAGNAQVSLTWTDPKDKYATPEGETAQDPDQLVSKWAYTRIVRKVGSQPTGPNDGTTVLESAVRNQYQTEPFVDTGLQNEVSYYYGAFAYNEDGVVSEGNFIESTPTQYITVGVKIDLNDSNPETSVTYTDDAEGLLPSENGDSGFVDNGWNARLQQICGIRPCLLKDGVVNYYLNPDDYSKKENGDPADIVSGEDGDVMVEFDHCYMRIYTDSNYLYVQLSQEAKEGFVDWPFYGEDKKPKKHMYIGVYLSSSGWRSLSGKSYHKTSYSNLTAIPTDRGTGYRALHYMKLCFLQVLYILRFKNLNSQSVIGRGSAVISGQGDTKGMYYGNKGTGGVIKTDGIENLWCSNMLCWINDMYGIKSGSYYIFTPDSRFTQNTDALKCLDTHGGYVSKVCGTNDKGFIASLNPNGLKGSLTTYFCDKQDFWLNGRGTIGFETNFGNGGYGIFGTTIKLDENNSYPSRITYCGGEEYEV